MSRLLDRDPLEELECDRWSALSGGYTRLMATVRELRRKPIAALTGEHLRLLIRQEAARACLLPLAVEVLRVDPLPEGATHEGDLLAAVLTRSAQVRSESLERGSEGLRVDQARARLGLPPSPSRTLP